MKMTAFIKKIQAAMEENRRMLPGVIVIIILVMLLAFRWGYRRHVAGLVEIAALEDLYRSSISLAQRGADISRLKAESEARIREREKGLLKAAKPTIAAAELVESFKAVTSRKGIVITSQRALAASDRAGYKVIPVEFLFRADLAQVKNLLYDIQSSQMLVGVRELKIKVPEHKDNGRLEVRLVIEGAIKKGGV